MNIIDFILATSPKNGCDVQDSERIRREFLKSHKDEEKKLEELKKQLRELEK